MLTGPAAGAFLLIAGLKIHHDYSVLTACHPASSAACQSLNRHFNSADWTMANLSAGIERHLDRLRALRDVRRLLTGLGDLRSELIITARYALAELDQETELLQILATEARARPQLVQAAADQLLNATATEFAGWLRERAGRRLTQDKANSVASIGLGALISSRVLPLLGITPIALDDQALVDTWAGMMIALIDG